MKQNLMNMLVSATGTLLKLGQPDSVSLDKVRDLNQTDEIWMSTVQLARTWIAPPDQDPYRPYLVLTVSEDNLLVGVQLMDEDFPEISEILEQLAKMMRYPILGSGKKRRPAAIYLDDQNLVEKMAPALEEVGIRCKYRQSIHQIRAVLEEMEAFMGPDEAPLPGLLETPGITHPMAKGFFEAADYFYREAPWRWIDDTKPIEIHYPIDSQAHYAVVMGHGGQVYGLTIYDSLDVLRDTYAGKPPEQLLEHAPWVVVLFDEAIEMSFDDLDNIEKYGWPVVDKQAYPLVLRIMPSGALARPGKSDLLRLEAALLALPTFMRDHLHANEGFPRAAEVTQSITMADGENSILLRYPVPNL